MPMNKGNYQPTRVGGWKRKGMRSSNMSGENVGSLQVLAEKTGLSLSVLLYKALCRTLTRSGCRDERMSDPIDLDHLRKLVAKSEAELLS